MKKKKLVVIGIIAGLISMQNVSASNCESTELSMINQEATKVKVAYEIKTKSVPNNNPELSDTGERPETVEYSFINVKITNLTGNLYIKLFNSTTGESKLFSSSDATDGVINYEIDDDSIHVANLDYKLYTSSQTKCANEEIVANTIKLPAYNIYYQTGPCITETDAPECQMYVTEEITADQFQKLAEKVEKRKADDINQKDKDEDKSFFEKNKMALIIGGSVIIVSGVVTTGVVIKKRRSRLIW